MLVYDSNSDLIHEVRNRRKVDEFDSFILNSGESVVSANVQTDYNLALNMTFLVYTNHSKVVEMKRRVKTCEVCELPCARHSAGHSQATGNVPEYSHIMQDNSLSFDLGKSSLHTSMMIK